MFKNLVVNYFKNKVEGHKGQDRKGGREIVDEYIDEHVWRCSRVVVQSVELNLILIPEGKLSSNFTAQRGDNGLCHSIDNSEAYCCHCNSSSH